eukprot:scaffold50078_cov51-Attheya_sp.AAC.4
MEEMTPSVVEHGDQDHVPHHRAPKQSKNKGPSSSSVVVAAGGGAANNIPHKPSKLGRKGDPRMHLALGLRLVTPEMSLLDALRGGGFCFSTSPHHHHGSGNNMNDNDDHDHDHEPQLDDTTNTANTNTSNSKGVMVDDDMVPLGQRKNQLSRRLRLAKQAMENNLPVNLGDYIISNGRVIQGPDSDGKVNHMNHHHNPNMNHNTNANNAHKNNNANKNNKGPSSSQQQPPPRTNNNNKTNKRRTRAGSDAIHLGSPNQSQLPRSDSFLSIDTNYLRETMGVPPDDETNMDEAKAIQRIARNHPMFGMSFPVTNPFSQAQSGAGRWGGGPITSNNSNTNANVGGNSMGPIMGATNAQQQQQQQQFSNSFPYGMMNPQLGGGGGANNANSNKLNVFDQAQHFVAHMGIGGTSGAGGGGGGPMMNAMTVPSGAGHVGVGSFSGQSGNMIMSNASLPSQPLQQQQQQQLQQHVTSQNQAGLMGMPGGQLPGGGRLPNGTYRIHIHRLAFMM